MTEPDEVGLTPEAAQGYEAFFVPAIFHQWPPVLMADADIRPTDHVLDVGCGTGVLTRELLKVVGPEGSVTAIDLSESMLSVARTVCIGANCHLGNAANLPFDDNRFDAVISSFMLMFAEDPQQVLRELKRVLKPGGRLVVAIWSALEDNPAYAALVETAREVLDDEAARSLAWPFVLGQEGRLSELMKGAGIEQADVCQHPGNAVFPSLDEFVRIEIQAWLLAGSVDDESLHRITALIRSNYPQYRDIEEPLEFSLNALVAKHIKAKQPMK
jgi:SAM-dependent methyltransferase